MKLRLFLACISILAIACGGNVKDKNGICNGAAAPDECGGECSVDGDCPLGFYCGSTGCSADCQTSGDCSGNKICTNEGRCVDPGDVPDADCPDVVARAEPQTPTVVILIDRSGSMTESFDDPNGNTSDRWTELRRALTNLGGGNGVLDNLQADVVFGATLYSSTGGNAGGTCPELQSVAASLNNAGAIDTLMEGNFPIDGADTPTAESLAAAYANFPATVTPTSPRILILATDGDPDTCIDPGSNGDQAPRNGSEAAVTAGFGVGVQTYVLSVGDGPTASHLNNMARLGLGQDPTTGAATAFIATDANALEQAFVDIIGGVRSCIFDLDGEVTADSAAQGDVRLDGTTLVLGSDWQLNGTSAIELVGDACSTFLDTTDAALTASFPCGGFIVQ